MSYRTEYYETIDYTWAIARQLDRVAEAYSKIDPSVPGLGVRRLLMAVRALYALARLWAPREGLEALEEAERLSEEGRNKAALRMLDRALELILRELDRKGLLVRKSDLPVGAYGLGEE